MMTEKQIKYALIGGVVLNLAMCLNLYRQMLSLQYQVTQLETDSMSAIQSLSRYVWEMKNPDANGYSGDFR